MTNLELMLLEHAASLSYAEITTTVDAKGDVSIRMRTQESTNNAFANIRLSSDINSSSVSFEERDNAGDIMTKCMIKCKNTTDVVQALNKFTLEIKRAKLDMPELCRPYMAQPQPCPIPNVPNWPTAHIPPIPMPCHEEDVSVGVRNDLVLGIECIDGGLALMSTPVGDSATDAFSFGGYSYIKARHAEAPPFELPLPPAPTQTPTNKGDDE